MHVVLWHGKDVKKAMFNPVYSVRACADTGRAQPTHAVVPPRAPVVVPVDAGAVARCSNCAGHDDAPTVSGTLLR